MPDDYSSTTQTTGTVAVDGSTRGNIETSGDHDWFAVTLDAGSTYRIDLEGYWTGDGTLYDPYLHGVYDANGVLLDGTTDDDAGTGYYNSLVFFTAQEAGTYYVAAGAYDDEGGTYTLSVANVPTAPWTISRPGRGRPARWRSTARRRALSTTRVTATGSR